MKTDTDKDYDVTLRGHHLSVLYSFYLRHGKHRIRKTSIEEHNKPMAENTIKVLKKIVSSNLRVKIVDTIDDICQACDERKTRVCKEFIPYGISAASADRATAHHYGFKIGKVYSSKYILRRIKEKGRMD